MSYYFISEEEQFSCDSTWFDILSEKNAVRSSNRRCSRLYQNETPAQVFSCGTCLVFTSSYFEQHLLFAVWSLGVIAYKCRNTNNKNLKLTFFSFPRNRKIGLCKEHFQESSFNKPVDLGRRWTVKINLSARLNQTSTMTFRSNKYYLWMIHFELFW